VKKAEKEILKRADAVTVLTQKHLDFNRSLDYMKNRDIPMDVVPCCVDMGRFRYDTERGSELKKRLGLDGKFVLLYPGKIGTFYLIDEMLGFYRTMARMVPGSVFLVVTNDDPSFVIERARLSGAPEETVRVIRGVPFEEMPLYINVADAGLFFINSYRKIGSSPIKMGEFLACGIPVIINPGVGDTDELVRQNRVGIVVEKFSEDRYADAVNMMMGLKAEGESLRRRCRQTAGRYLSLSGGVERYAAIYGLLAGAGMTS
jgi:glycosyltransferase involved in cell wall biosynthesis